MKKVCSLIEKEMKKLSLEERIEYINNIKRKLHEMSPMKNEPVDCVIWVKNEVVKANDYNPNSVAPPEMKLLELSIAEDGYTQPIVTWQNGEALEVVDGFHRNRVGKECSDITERIHGYLPVVIANDDRTDKGDRIASTIRHNRARGKHMVNAMSEIVIELKNRNWKNERIAKELGMDEDEILRLMQITGLQELFKDADFSRSWMIEDSEVGFEELTDEVSDEEAEINKWRTVNTDDPDRIFHTYDKWECYKAGFYATTKEGMTEEQCEREYFKLLTNEKLFSETLEKVITEWKFSCEHYLTNKSMNRIAWLGQAALCYAKGIPSTYRGGFNLLSPEQQDIANGIALKYLNKWMEKNNRLPVEAESALAIGRQAEIY